MVHIFALFTESTKHINLPRITIFINFDFSHFIVIRAKKSIKWICDISKRWGEREGRKINILVSIILYNIRKKLCGWLWKWFSLVLVNLSKCFINKMPLIYKVVIHLKEELHNFEKALTRRLMLISVFQNVNNYWLFFFYIDHYFWVIGQFLHFQSEFEQETPKKANKNSRTAG